MKARGTDQWQDNLYNIKSMKSRGADQWHNNYWNLHRKNYL